MIIGLSQSFRPQEIGGMTNTQAADWAKECRAFGAKDSCACQTLRCNPNGLAVHTSKRQGLPPSGARAGPIMIHC